MKLSLTRNGLSSTQGASVANLILDGCHNKQYRFFAIRYLCHFAMAVEGTAALVAVSLALATACSAQTQNQPQTQVVARRQRGCCTSIRRGELPMPALPPARRQHPHRRPRMLRCRLR